jgi:serine protein kinase
LSKSENRNIEIDGYKWPIDTLVIATSNNSGFNRFLVEKEEAPNVDRCRICYVSHNTNHKFQNDLTGYSICSEARTILTREALHQGSNLNYAASVASVLTLDAPAALRKADPHRNHETGRRRSGRRKEHQNTGRSY